MDPMDLGSSLRASDSLRASQLSFDGSFSDFTDEEGGFTEEGDGGLRHSGLHSSGEFDGDAECPVCQKLVPRPEFSVHVDRCVKAASEEEASTSAGGEGGSGGDGGGDGMSECPVCEGRFPAEQIATHVDRCLLNSSGEMISLCGLCGESFPASLLEMHEEECKRLMQMKQDEELARSLAEGGAADFGKPSTKAKTKTTKTKTKPPAASSFTPATAPGGASSEPPPVRDVAALKGVKTHECPLCKRVLPMSEMKAHFDECLKDTKGRQMLRDMEETQEWTCEHCLEVFVDKDFYDLHTSMCSDKGARVQCGACGKYTYENLLEEHKGTECRMHKCSLCGEMFAIKELHTHMEGCAGPKEECPRCGDMIAKAELRSHVKFCREQPRCSNCLERFPLADKQFEKHLGECRGRQIKCHVCLQSVFEMDLNEHLKKCATRDADESRAVAWEGEEKAAIGIIRTLLAGELTDRQLQAVVWVQENSERLSERAYPGLVTRFASLGWNETVLKRTLRYIRTDAPIIVHVNMDKCIEFFLSDTHYRNQFETNTSNGTLNQGIRKQWEDRLFNNIYKDSDGFERCKYGVLNVINDPNGVQCCSQYGDSYMVLKDARLRCTFSAKDSSCADVIPSSGTQKPTPTRQAHAEHTFDACPIFVPTSALHWAPLIHKPHEALPQLYCVPHHSPMMYILYHMYILTECAPPQWSTMRTR
eukprot:TRINITY_DN634_c0_g1_i1.p1 TRINITY_DN634_c0_g1~~TRINITY_DN634_c0_g1_i1.p1  ORF type:complete len:704 (-),score=224.31 TRINITY_DN634_c0_g1_i1:491-2602(-)